ncbi:hypothetical protein L6452_02108 [Arctium lappa]|uniref:Uncharacterized protein n=1 Tax=Arctium lappa TaxID=4217 RepID=A0ACB9FJB7_ARCLA|nr:hypothetical protein L6452_02108 [Arctium lappa]
MQETSHLESSDNLINDGHTRNDSPRPGDEEVSIRIIGSEEKGIDRDGGGASSSTVGQMREGTTTQNESLVQSNCRTNSTTTMDTQGDSRSDSGSACIRGATDSASQNVDVEVADGIDVNNSRDSYIRDIMYNMLPNGTSRLLGGRFRAFSCQQVLVT